MKNVIVVFSFMFTVGAYAYGNQFGPQDSDSQASKGPERLAPLSTNGTCYNLRDCSGSILGSDMDSNDCESQGGESIADNFGYCTNF
jgi:hypothetical protein